MQVLFDADGKSHIMLIVVKCYYTRNEIKMIYANGGREYMANPVKWRWNLYLSTRLKDKLDEGQYTQKWNVISKLEFTCDQC